LNGLYLVGSQFAKAGPQHPVEMLWKTVAQPLLRPERALHCARSLDGMGWI